LQTPPSGEHDDPQRPSISQWPLQQSESSLQSKPSGPQIIVAHALLVQTLEQHCASIVHARPASRHTTAPQVFTSFMFGSGGVQSPALAQQSPSLMQRVPSVLQQTLPTQSATP
jgi:hypothetical protein